MNYNTETMYKAVAQTKDGSVAMNLHYHPTIKSAIREFDETYHRQGFKIEIVTCHDSKHGYAGTVVRTIKKTFK